MKIVSLFLILATAVSWSCNLEEINENPNVPLDVPLNTLLAPAQKGIADAQGGRLFRYTGIFGQQLRGVEAQELLIENYQPDELFVGAPWQDVYVGSLINLNIIVERASESSPHYAGVAKILMATAYGILTDTWGDVPATEALQGGVEPHPVFDNQQAIYAYIFALLDAGMSDLQQENSVFSPGSDDLMYGGDLNRWMVAASVLSARYELRLSKRFDDASNKALEALLVNRMLSPDDDLMYPYLGTGDETNPIAGFYASAPLAFMDPQYLAIINDLDDPRASTITRVVPLSGGNRKPGNYWSEVGAPLRLISYLEQQFILAEAYLRTGALDQAQDALENAVRTSMTEVSAGEITQEQADTYIEAQAQLNGSFDENLNAVMTQKYIALLTTPEPWADWRRTGFPLLVPNADAAGASNPSGEIPRRLIYPQSERLRNNNFPQPAPNMQTRFWWDLN
jgi:hypothetical protein